MLQRIWELQLRLGMTVVPVYNREMVDRVTPRYVMAAAISASKRHPLQPVLRDQDMLPRTRCQVILNLSQVV